jgi:hypothetical protein
MAVNVDREYPFGPLLPYDILIQHILDLGRCWDLGDGLSDLSLLVLRENLITEGDALVADVHGRTRNELPDRVLGLSAKRAP